MKRRIAVLLTIALLLSLSACGDDPGVGDPPLLFTKPTAEEDPTEPSNIVPTQVPTVAPTAAPTQEPTQAPTAIPTEPPTEEPTLPPTVYPIDMDAIRAYSAAPVGYMAFEYYTTSSQKEPGLVGVEEGFLYGIENGQRYLLTDQGVSQYRVNVTSEHVYYVTDAERNIVYRTDHYGKERTAIFEVASGKIFCIDFAGVDPNGDLFVGILDDAGRYRIDMHNIGQGTTQTLFEAAAIVQFTYVLMAYDPYVGPIIRWSGTIDDPEQRGMYYYHFSSGTHEKPPTAPPAEKTPVEPGFYIEEAFVYDGYKSPSMAGADFSQCVHGNMYGYDKETNAILLICEDVLSGSFNDTTVFFVKKLEPTKIYQASRYDPTVHRVLYESNKGNITDLSVAVFFREKNSALYLIIDGRYGVALELITGETIPMVEGWYIKDWSLTSIEGSWRGFDEIYYIGEFTESDAHIAEYLYYRESGYACLCHWL